jgi:antitoxin Phd
MKVWSVQAPKARFSKLLKASLTEGPQIVTLRGIEAAVLISMEEWQSLRERARPGLKAFLLAPEARGELNISPRGRRRTRVLRSIG